MRTVHTDEKIEGFACQLLHLIDHMTAGHAHVLSWYDADGERGCERLGGCDRTFFYVVDRDGEVDGKSPLRGPAGHFAEVTTPLFGDGQGDLGDRDVDCVRDGDQLTRKAAFLYVYNMLSPFVKSLPLMWSLFFLYIAGKK